MSHRLEPPAGRPYLEPEEVVERLRDEFAYCDADAEEGVDTVGNMLAKLIELKAPQAMIDEVMAGRDRAISLVVADDMASDNYLSFTIRPGNGLLIGYHSAQHEAATRSLVERCAGALNYEIHLV